MHRPTTVRSRHRRTFGVDWPHLTAQIISFSIVCALLYRLAYQPVLQMLDARRQQIAQGLANTEKINAALAAIEDERRQTLAAAQAEATRMIAEARDVAQRLQAQETQRATATAEQISSTAREAAAQRARRGCSASCKRDVGRLVVRPRPPSPARFSRPTISGVSPREPPAAGSLS